MPLRNDLADDPEIKADPMLAQFVQIGNNARSYPLPSPVWAEIAANDIVDAVQKALLAPDKTDEIFRISTCALTKKLPRHLTRPCTTTHARARDERAPMPPPAGAGARLCVRRAGRSLFLCAVIVFPLGHAFWTSLQRVRGLNATFVGARTTTRSVLRRRRVLAFARRLVRVHRARASRCTWRIGLALALLSSTSCASRAPRCASCS